MKRYMKFITENPTALWGTVIVLYTLLSTLFFPVHYLFPESNSGLILGDALVKILVFLIMVLIIHKIRWTEQISVLQSGNLKIWLLVIPIVIYKLLIEVYSFSEQIGFSRGDTKSLLPYMLFYLTGAMVEELMYRGIILSVMLKVWGNRGRGLYKSVILSSVFFGAMHLLNLFVDPIGEVLVQSIIVMLPGIIYATFVIIGKSLWPVIFIHSITNFVVNVQLMSMDEYEITFYNWILFGGFLIPLILLSFVALRRYDQSE